MTNTARQPAGVPIGGQFAATAHSEPQVGISSGAPLPQQWADRDLVRERRTRLQDQLEELDRLSQAHSVRGVASALLAKYPDAATLHIAENEDGENQYDVMSLRRADGSIIEDIDDDGDWIWDEATPDGPQIQELIYDLDLKDDSWAAGTAEVTGNKHTGKTAVIRLADAAAAPLPVISAQESVYTRTLTEDEQETLVRAAHDGVTEMEDILGERAADYDPEDLRIVQERLDAVNRVLGNSQ